MKVRDELQHALLVARATQIPIVGVLQFFVEFG